MFASFLSLLESAGFFNICLRYFIVFSAFFKSFTINKLVWRTADGSDGYRRILFYAIKAVLIRFFGAPPYVVDDLFPAHGSVPVAERPHPIGLPFLQGLREVLIGREIRRYDFFEVFQNLIGFLRIVPDATSHPIEVLIVLIEAHEGIKEVILIFLNPFVVNRSCFAISDDL